jgi:hypothetical protein
MLVTSMLLLTVLYTIKTKHIYFYISQQIQRDYYIININYLYMRIVKKNI